jgi:Protein of unknown function (DUF1638)
MTTATAERLLVVACGALAREVLAIVRANGWEHVDVRCLPAQLHSSPRRIPQAVDEALEAAAGSYDRIFVAYADCGTAGGLDEVLEKHGAERLPGAHCYAVFAGLKEWDALHDEEPGTFYLTDFLVRHFESLVIRPLGLDRHPELADDIFGNYRRVVYLAQTDDPALLACARACAASLGLVFEFRRTGHGRLASSLTGFARVA